MAAPHGSHSPLMAAAAVAGILALVVAIIALLFGDGLFVRGEPSVTTPTQTVVQTPPTAPTATPETAPPATPTAGSGSALPSGLPTGLPTLTPVPLTTAAPGPTSSDEAQESFFEFLHRIGSGWNWWQISLFTLVLASAAAVAGALVGSSLAQYNEGIAAAIGFSAVLVLALWLTTFWFSLSVLGLILTVIIALGCFWGGVVSES